MGDYRWTERDGFFQVIKGFDGNISEIDRADTVKLELGKYLFTVEVIKVIPPGEESREFRYKGIVKAIEDWTGVDPFCAKPALRHAAKGHKRGDVVTFKRKHVSCASFVKNGN